MAGEQLRTFLRRLRCAAGPEAGGASDAQLLERFATRRDECAFEVLVWRHGGLVLHVCRRVLRHAEDAEDAFQATFLVLARRAGSIGKGEALAGWLYKVAYRAALRLRARGAREAARRRDRPTPPAPRPAGEAGADVRPVLDEEIDRLPEKYRAAVVLCYLQGKTAGEAARVLGCARGTVCSRLAWARQRLRGRLTRRGLALAAAGLAVPLAPAAAPAALVGATVKGAVLFASGQVAGGALPGPTAALAEGVLRTMVMTKLKTAAGLLLLLGALGVGTGLCVQRGLAQRPGADVAPALVRGNDGIRLPPDMPAKLGIRVGEVKPRAAARPRVLRLSGSTAIDPDHLLRVRCRCAPAEVVEIGKAEGEGENRPLRTGDKVRKGQLLAVFHSAAVGEKKNDLFDALVQLRLDEAILERAEQARDAVPEVFLLNARRRAQADRSAVNRAVNTLRVLGVPQADIDTVSQEAEAAGKRPGKRASDRDKQWARVELRAPEDGTIVERNVALHEVVADGPVNLFQIARLDRLLVIVNAPEDELPALNVLKPEERVWTVRAAGAAAGIQGRIEEIGYLIDPNQHTVVLKGHVENREGLLRAGQFITASITLPAAGGEVALPAAAVVEEGGRDFVFVQPDARRPIYEERRVLVVRRSHDAAHVGSRLTPAQERQGLQAVRAGERVVTAGALELKALLDDLKAREGR
jgi:cobalt-zinc-cadmium efflux system membrane fusion protein